MEVQIKAQPGVYCDTGRHNGKTRIDFRGAAYMSDEEYHHYLEHGMTMVLMDRRADTIAQAELRGMSRREQELANMDPAERARVLSVRRHPSTGPSEPDDWRAARGAVPRPADAPRAEEVIRALRDDEECDDDFQLGDS